MTTTGPLEVSGLAAGVSVEGPMASVSLRVRSVGGVLLEVVAVSVAVSIVSGCGTCWVCPSVAMVSVVCAGVSDAAVGSEADAGNVFISTGLVEVGAWELFGREVDCAGCGGLVAAGS